MSWSAADRAPLARVFHVGTLRQNLEVSTSSYRGLHQNSGATESTVVSNLGHQRLEDDEVIRHKEAVRTDGTSIDLFYVKDAKAAAQAARFRCVWLI